MAVPLGGKTRYTYLHAPVRQQAGWRGGRAVFVSVSLVRMPPLNWGGDSDFFYHATYGPAVRGADGLQRAIFGHVSRLTEGRPRFTHGLVFWWDSPDAWEAATRRAAGMPPLPKASQGLETYTGDFAGSGLAGEQAGQGVFGISLFNVAPDAPSDALAGHAAQLWQLAGVRGVWAAGTAGAEGGDAPRPGAAVLLVEFESADAAERSLRTESAPRWLMPAWASDIEPMYLDFMDIL
jgi:hypothetical protein